MKEKTHGNCLFTVSLSYSAFVSLSQSEFDCFLFFLVFLVRTVHTMLPISKCWRVRQKSKLSFKINSSHLQFGAAKNVGKCLTSPTHIWLWPGMWQWWVVHWRRLLAQFIMHTHTHVQRNVGKYLKANVKFTCTWQPRQFAVWLWIWAQRQKAAYSWVDFNSSRLWCFCGVHGAKTTQRHNIYSSLHFHKHTGTSARRMKACANTSETCIFLHCHRGLRRNIFLDENWRLYEDRALREMV